MTCELLKAVRTACMEIEFTAFQWAYVTCNGWLKELTWVSADENSFDGSRRYLDSNSRQVPMSASFAYIPRQIDTADARNEHFGA